MSTHAARQPRPPNLCPGSRAWHNNPSDALAELRHRLAASGDWRELSSIDGTTTYSWAGTKRQVPAVAVGRSALIVLACGLSLRVDDLIGARVQSLRLVLHNAGHHTDLEAVESLCAVVGIDPRSGRPTPSPQGPKQ